ncbi:penicillin acylase family protein [Micromonospora sp. KC606]|uniref:penicillin acylase family protein n=1 Tax=Micromonospora sp. KC606 TaxID=2530379 RepID=UPI001050799D|nr:penicillin acylase family protein [Micromonospora sp. KC606]TDC83655.1 penicillin acylase family protein [Micromonospora sp. KC606]
MWALAALVAVTVLLGLAGVWTIRRSFPQYGGEATLPGLGAQVTVHHDASGVPHVYAETEGDLFRAQGYLHAQERFWEMDFRRHVTSGRLSELFGAGQVETDTYLRTLGWRRVAEREWSLIAVQSRAYLQAYADGVNAWLDQHGGGDPGGDVSLEYAVLGLQNRGYRIERWDPVDSLAWLKAMAWDLRGNMVDEAERAILLGRGLSREQVEQLYPPYPYRTHRPVVAGGDVATGAFVASTAGTGGGVPVATLDALRDDLAALPALLGRAGHDIGSNSWVLAGSRTATGKPLLANDPHLAPSMPGIWFQVGLHCACGYEVTGFSFSGVPGAVIGHNARIAWGFTNLGPDVTDLYLEKVEGDRVRVDGGWQNLDRRQETIRVAGGDPVTVTVRTSRNGPLLSDASEELRDAGGGYAVALRWTALDPGRTIDALFALNRARDWTSFRAAAALFEVPAQNIVYADVDGNIGYQAPGRIPVRGAGDGRWPAPGWDSAYAWRSFIAFDELPSVFNPPEGYVVAANQAVTGPGYRHLLTDDWSYGYRSERIHQMLTEAGAGITTGEVQRMQADSHNGLAATLVPVLLRASLSGTARQAQDLLRDWNFQQPAGDRGDRGEARSSAAAAYFNAVWRALLRRTFDELPDGHAPDGGDRWWEVMRGLVTNPSSPWWDDRRTPVVETADQVVAAAMAEAAEELADRLGDDLSRWRWGDLHTLTPRNQTFGESGIAPIEWLFNGRGAGVSGGSSIVNATGWDASVGYEVDWVPSMRMIVDMSDLDESRWIQLTGNSGHAFADHYDDQFEKWRTGQTVPMRWDRATIEREAADSLTLVP